MAESKAIRAKGEDEIDKGDAGTASIDGRARFLTLSNNEKWRSLFPPLKDEPKAMADLRVDLAEVPVLAQDGKVTNIYDKLEAEPLSRKDKDMIWHCLALVRESYILLEARDSKESGAGYQWNMNWMHTRAELDQVLEASRCLDLDHTETRDALIASIFSDAVKNRGNFIIHNIHGAEAAALVLSYFFDPTNSEDMYSAERIVLAIKQHQIAPPEFMARTVAVFLIRQFQLEPFDRLVAHSATTDIHKGRLHKMVLSIYSKIRQPYVKAHLTADLGRIDFTAEEREMLLEIGIEDWYVPHPEVRASAIAHALIAGDHSINYNNPDGFAKIALIRGPYTEAYFEDGTIYDSLESAMASFGDSYNILLPEVRSLALNGIRRTHSAVTRVLRIMTELFAGITVGPRDNINSLSGNELVREAIERARQKNPDIFESSQGFSSDEGHKNKERAIKRVGDILIAWKKENGTMPFCEREHSQSEPGPGRLPFWNTPLRYPLRDQLGEPIISSLTELEQKQFAFAFRIREIAVELLRAEQWFFN